MGSSIHLKEATVVTPREQTPACVLSLSALDSQLFLRFTIEYLLVYRARPGQDPSAITTRVKSALAKALVPYFPLSGRVRTRPDGSGLEVHCKSQGAVFIEAVSEQHVAGDFEGAPRYVTEWRKLLSLQVADVLKGAPPLVVQLTWLKDGAAALAVGFNHCVCDGIGSATFLNSLAELSNPASHSQHADSKRKPVWDRHLLDPTPRRQNRRDWPTHPEFNRVPDLCGFSDRFSNERLVPTSVVFHGHRLSELKKLALSTSRPSESAGYTSFEALAAHVWRSWARSLNMPASQAVKLLFSINVRDRVKPGLPSGFYGNAFVLGCAQTTAKDLTEKGVGHAAMLVKKAKERVDDEHVRSLIECVGKSRANPDSVGVLILSQWSKLGLEKVDFGMGRPFHVGSVCCDRYCLLLPVPERSDAVKVMVAVPSTAADSYETLLTNPYR